MGDPGRGQWLQTSGPAEIRTARFSGLPMLLRAKAEEVGSWRAFAGNLGAGMKILEDRGLFQRSTWKSRSV
jgi:hypothetical protein